MNSQPTYKPFGLSPNGPPQTDDPILRMQISLFEHGYERAVKSGAVKPDEEGVVALKEHASTIARETYRELYDPNRNPHDHPRDEEYRKKLEDRKEAELALKYATEELRDKEEEAAKARCEEEKPRPSSLLAAAGVIVTAITVAPTLHDFIF